MRLDTYLSHYTKINFTCIKDLNATSETLKLLEEKERKTFQVTGKGKDFLNKMLAAQETLLTTDKWDPMKLKGFAARERANGVKRKSTEREKMVSSYIYDRGVMSRLHKTN